MIGAEAEPEVAALAVGSGGRGKLWRRLRRNPVAIFAIAVLALIALSAILAPLLAPHDPNFANALDVRAPMSGAHPLGTDSAGRDELSRLLYAGMYSLAGALLALAIAMALGVSGGLIGGYYGGVFDSVFSWVTNLLMAIPAIVVLLAAAAVVGPSLWTSMIVFGVLMSPAFYRLVYATVNSVKNELYVDAARVSGLSDARIISRHVLAVVRAPIIIQASMITGIAIAIEAALDFLGLGDPTLPTWGNMLNDGFSALYNDRDLILWPALVIALTCVALTLLANAMRDALEETAVKQTRRERRRAKLAGGHVAPIEAIDPPVIHAEPAAAAVSSEPKLLEVEGLAIGYPDPQGGVGLVVRGVSLSVARGEVHGLIGESGSGKTQTAWAILGVLPDAAQIVGGKVKFDGQDLLERGQRGFSEVRGKRIAYIPQEPTSNLDPSFTVGSQLVEPLRVRLGMSKQQATATALDLLDRVGIVDPRRTFKAYPHEISGGMAQRVLIAGAVSCAPDLLIADEPTTALDVTVQAEVLDLLRGLQRESQMGMIMVTHNFGVVADICDRVSVMQQGLIVESGPVRSIFAEPRHAYTKSLFDAILDDDESDAQLVPAPTGQVAQP